MDMEIESDVSHMEDQNTNPVSHCQSCVSIASQRRLSHWPSTATPDADTSGVLIPLGNRPKGDVEPTPEWYALQQLVLGRDDKDNPPPPEADADSTNLNDMDLQSTTHRMLVTNAGIIQHSEKVLIAIDALIHAKSMCITYGIYLSYIPQTETNY